MDIQAIVGDGGRAGFEPSGGCLTESLRCGICGGSSCKRPSGSFPGYTYVPPEHVNSQRRAFDCNDGDRQHRADRGYWVRQSCFLLHWFFVAVVFVCRCRLSRPGQGCVLAGNVWHLVEHQKPESVVVPKAGGSRSGPPCKRNGGKVPDFLWVCTGFGRFPWAPGQFSYHAGPTLGPAFLWLCFCPLFCELRFERSRTCHKINSNRESTKNYGGCRFH